MKPFKMTPPKLPESKALKAGNAVLAKIGAFAHHPPASLVPEANPHFERPHGGGGPKNG